MPSHAVGSPRAGAARRQHRTRRGPHVAPVWSPDGQKISFLRPRGGTLGDEILTYDLASGTISQSAALTVQVQGLQWARAGDLEEALETLACGGNEELAYLAGTYVRKSKLADGKLLIGTGKFLGIYKCKLGENWKAHALSVFAD